MVTDHVGGGSSTRWIARTSYADNVAVNDGQTQPVRFALNEPVRLTDSFGASATVWFREMAGASCVFDYRYTG